MFHPYSTDLGTFAPCSPDDSTTHGPYVCVKLFRHYPHSLQKSKVFFTVVHAASVDSVVKVAPFSPDDLATLGPHRNGRPYRHDPYGFVKAAVFFTPVPAAPVDSLGTVGHQLDVAGCSSPARPQQRPQSKKTDCAPQCKHRQCLHGLSAAEQLARFDNGDTVFHNRGKKTMREPLKFRTQLCCHFDQGHCCLGDTCRMYHDPAQQRSEDDNWRDGIVTDVAATQFIREELLRRSAVEKNVEPVGTQSHGG